MKRLHFIALLGAVATAAFAAGRNSSAPPSALRSSRPELVAPVSASDQVVLFEAVEPGLSKTVTMRPHAVRIGDRYEQFYVPAPNAKLRSFRVNGVWVFCEEEWATSAPRGWPED